MQRADRGRARRHVPHLGGDHQRRDEQDRRRAAGSVVGEVVPQPVVGCSASTAYGDGASPVSRPPKRTTSATLRAVVVSRLARPRRARPAGSISGVLLTHDDELSSVRRRVGNLQLPMARTALRPISASSCALAVRWSGSRRAVAGDGRAPSRTSRSPIAAIIAPLSVHSRIGGTRSSMPAASQRSCASARTRELAATPPTMTSVSTSCCRQARSALVTRTSATASWKLAAMSSTSRSRRALDVAGDRGLQPGEGEPERRVVRAGQRARERAPRRVAVCAPPGRSTGRPG